MKEREESSMIPRLLVLTPGMVELSFNEMGNLHPVDERTCWGRWGHENRETSSGKWDL